MPNADRGLTEAERRYLEAIRDGIPGTYAWGVLRATMKRHGYTEYVKGKWRITPLGRAVLTGDARDV